MPPEYCQYLSKDIDECKSELSKTHPRLFKEVYGEDAAPVKSKDEEEKQKDDDGDDNQIKEKKEGEEEDQDGEKKPKKEKKKVGFK